MMPSTAPTLAVPRANWMDWSKALSILAVVLIHSISWAGHLGASAVVLDLAVATLMPVQDFFFVSGLLVASTIDKGRHTEFFRARVWPVVALYIAWQPIVLLYRLIAAGSLPDQADSAWPQQLLRLVVAPIRPNGELWYLWALIIYLVAARLVRSLGPVIPVVAAGLLSIAWTSAARTMAGPELWRAIGPGWHHLPECFFFFLLGIALRGPVLRWVPRVSSRVLIAFPLAYWLLIGVVFTTSIADVPGITFLRISAAAAAVLSSGVLLGRLFGSCRLGAVTLPVYLQHTLFIVVLVSIATALGLEVSSPTASIAVVGAIMTASITVSLLVLKAVAGRPAGWLFHPRFRRRPPLPPPLGGSAISER